MAPAGSGPCSCPCCKQDKCTCTGEPGKDCGCDNCKKHSASCGCGAKQQQECKCPCCIRKSCTCKQPSDCTCSECPKHACVCSKAAEKKKAEAGRGACDCCCCKTGSTTCCQEAKHVESCDCRCCKEKTCACCKAKEARAAGAAGAAEPAASGKTVSETAHDNSFFTAVDKNSSSSSSGHLSACSSTGSTRTTRCAYYHCHAPLAFRSSRHRHWNGNCFSSRRHCRRTCSSSNHMHFGSCTSRSQWCKNTLSESQCSTNTMYKRPNTEEEKTMNNNIKIGCCSQRCSSSSSSSASPACCFSSCYVPCCFNAPQFVSCGYASKQDDDDYCRHLSLHPCGDRDCCCSFGASRPSCCRPCVEEGPLGRKVAKSQTVADSTEASQPPDKRYSSASSGEAESSSSSNSRSAAAEQHSGAEHLDYARDERECIPCVRCCCYWQCSPTWNVSVDDEHELQGQQRIQMIKYVPGQHHPQCANEEHQQQLQERDEGQKSNTCIIDPNGRLLIECKTKEKVLLRRMQPADYPAVRALLPRVSRCSLVLTEQQVHDVLSSSVFYAWCCFTVEPKQHRRKQEGMLAQAITQQQHEVEKEHPPTQQQTEEDIHQQQSQVQEEGHLLEEELSDSSTPEYYREKQLVAYCELVLQPRLGRKTDGRLERVVVDEGFCGRGVASQMCASVLAAVKERELCGFVDLTVEKDEARHIYEDKLGFRKVETTVLRRQL